MVQTNEVGDCLDLGEPSPNHLKKLKEVHMFQYTETWKPVKIEIVQVTRVWVGLG